MDARLLFPNDYITAADLRGRDVTLTISKFKVEDLRTSAGSEPRGILYFAEMEERHRLDKSKPNKRFVLGAKINMRTIGKALGGFETNDWVGKRITLYPTTCQAFGETVDCIRIRDRAPAKETEAPE